jgi:hypothetical protein
MELLRKRAIRKGEVPQSMICNRLQSLCIPAQGPKFCGPAWRQLGIGAPGKGCFA